MEYSDVDIIVAPATNVSVTSPLAIIRVSGDGCIGLVGRYFKSKSEKGVRLWRMSYGDWVDESGVVDDVMIVGYGRGKSYTGQEMLEIVCHGNILFVDLIIACLLKVGVRRARPGEFTMRAVLNGKMGLLQAESVNVLLESNTRYQADLARRQSRGPLVGFIKDQVESILQIQAHIEATIDYGEEDVDALEREKLVVKIEGILVSLVRLWKTAGFARSMRRGFRVMIVGAPNVGKSTLFNAIVRKERAIVTHLPGTTRDVISEEIEIEGLPVVLMDSAGVRQTEDIVEVLGIEKLYEMMDDVDLIVYLYADKHEEMLLERLKAMPEEKWMMVQSKSDVSGNNDVVDGILKVSAMTGEGIVALEEKIVVRLSSVMDGMSVYLINQRQSEVVSSVIDCLKRAKEEYEAGHGEEILSSFLNTARRLLGELTGETTVEDILDRMFSNFCLGK